MLFDTNRGSWSHGLLYNRIFHFCHYLFKIKYQKKVHFITPVERSDDLPSPSGGTYSSNIRPKKSPCMVIKVYWNVIQWNDLFTKNIPEWVRLMGRSWKMRGGMRPFRRKCSRISEAVARSDPLLPPIEIRSGSKGWTQGCIWRIRRNLGSQGLCRIALTGAKKIWRDARKLIWIATR